MIRVNLSEASLNGANLQGATIQNSNLIEVDLSGANLSRANLNRTDLSRADLSQANLNQANLSRTNLSQVDFCGAQALGTNFSEALFTAACLENWNVNSTTIFDHTHCEYFYLQSHQQERRPRDNTFKAEEFQSFSKKP